MTLLVIIDTSLVFMHEFTIKQFTCTVQRHFQFTNFNTHHIINLNKTIYYDILN